MKVFAVLAIFALGSISVSTGLKCYSCVYRYNTTGSHDDCEKNPPETYLADCLGPPESLIDENSQISHVSNTTSMKAVENPGNSSKDAGDIICYTMNAEVDGRKHLERGCIRAHRDGDLNGVCEDWPDTGIIKNPEYCFCIADGCNSGVSLVSFPVFTIIGLGLLMSYLNF